MSRTSKRKKKRQREAALRRQKRRALCVGIISAENSSDGDEMRTLQDIISWGGSDDFADHEDDDSLSSPGGRHGHSKPLDVELMTTEIYTEHTPVSDSERVQELYERGVAAFNAEDFSLAESLFEEILREEPHLPNAIYNRCTIWMMRDGKEGADRARSVMEQLHREHPDYVFAAIGVAQFAAIDGDLPRARELLYPIAQSNRMHISEAIALLTAQAQLEMEDDDLESARSCLEMVEELAGEDSPTVRSLRRRFKALALKNRISAIADNLFGR